MTHLLSDVSLANIPPTNVTSTAIFLIDQQQALRDQYSFSSKTRMAGDETTRFLLYLTFS